VGIAICLHLSCGQSPGCGLGDLSTIAEPNGVRKLVATVLLLSDPEVHVGEGFQLQALPAIREATAHRLRRESRRAARTAGARSLSPVMSTAVSHRSRAKSSKSVAAIATSVSFSS
jgi:hypothetical protein